jgi:hypothetical protein
MLLVLQLSLLTFATLAVAGIPLNHARRAAQATSVTLNGLTYVNQVSAPTYRVPFDKIHHHLGPSLGPRRIRAHPVRRHRINWFVVM